MEAGLWELAEGDPAEEVEVIIRLHRPDAVPPGVRIVAQFGMIATCRLPRRLLVGVRRHEDIASMKAPLIMTPGTEASPLDEEAFEPSSQSDSRRPRDESATGRGVVVGVIDWGCDFTHPNFRYPDGRTRLLALWDQAAPYSPERPNRYAYGVVHSSARIDRALASERPATALGYSWFRSDATRAGAHGSHVMDIAAGNGRVGPAGVAPGADLVFVQLANRGPRSRGLPEHLSLGNSVSLLEALDFILRIAGPRPVCINTSMGRQTGPHDGSSLVEQAFDAALDLIPGRFIGQSTGNYYDRDAHASGHLRPGQSVSLPFMVSEADVTPNELEIWYRGRDVMAVEVRTPAGVLSKKTGPEDEASIREGGRELCRVYHRAREPNNFDNTIHVYLYAGAPAGRWELVLTGIDIVDGRFEAWIERDSGCAECQARFDFDYAVPLMTTGTICNGFRTVAVGAYNAHDPERRIATFSSSGPTRDGRIKPDLVAPGVQVLAARSAPDETGEPTSYVTRKSGTSMASPHVVGLVALMFEVAGRLLNIKETRNLLLTSTRGVKARGDAAHRIGSGYLDMDAAIDSTRRYVQGDPVAAISEIPMRDTSLPTETEATAGAPPSETSVQPEAASADVAAPLEDDPGSVTLRYGVPNGRITDPFYRDPDDKRRLTGGTRGRSRHLGIDVSTSSASGGGADDARRGLPVYAAIRASIPVSELNAARTVDSSGANQTGLGVRGSGSASLDHAIVLTQPWSLRDDGAYGGVLGLACRYKYTKADGSTGTLTLYLECLHLITSTFLPKDGRGRIISAEDWAATGKGIGFGPSMQDQARLSASTLTGGAPLLVGYLGATQFPHVHIQAAARLGTHKYLRGPRFDPTVMLHASLEVSRPAEAQELTGTEAADWSELATDLEEAYGPAAHSIAVSEGAEADAVFDESDNEHRPLEEEGEAFAEDQDSEESSGETAVSASIVESADAVLAEAARPSPQDYFGRALGAILSRMGGTDAAASITPAALFQAFRQPAAVRPPGTLGQAFTLIAAPGGPLSGSVRPGDILLRRVPEHGYTHVAFVASPDVLPYDQTVARGWRAESGRPGYYVVVIEGGPRPHRHGDWFARRLLDRSGRAPGDQLLLRLKGNGTGRSSRRSGNGEAETVAIPAGSPLPTADRVDPADPRIDVSAKFSLQRLLRRPDTRQEATEILGAVNAGTMAGIYGDDLRKAAELAARRNTVRWELVSPGRDAEVVADPLGAPSLIFRERLRGNTGQLDLALIQAWRAFRPSLMTVPVPVPVPSVPPGLPDIPGIIPVVFPPPGLPATTPPLSPPAVPPVTPPVRERSTFRLLLDANRNGSADATAATGPWQFGPRGRGAIILVNNDDDGINGQPDNQDAAVDRGNDTSELAPLVIERTTAAAPPTGTVLELSVDNKDNIRIFERRAAGAAEIIGPSVGNAHRFSSLSRRRIELGMEGVRYAGPGFAGEVTLTLRATDPSGAVTSQSSVVRTAPWVIPNHLHQAEKVFVVDAGSFNDAFRQRLRTLVRAAGCTLDEIRNNDIWAQDCMEFGFSNLPTKGIRAVLRAPRPRPLRTAPRALLNADLGYFEVGTLAPITFNSTGNLEATPPVTSSAGKRYPHGRIYFGPGRGVVDLLDPDLKAFLQAQIVQSPIEVDTAWLTVGHVDEVISFVPAPGAKGFKLLLASPRRAYEILDGLRTTHGSAKLLVGREFPIFDPVTEAFRGNGSVEKSITDFLAARADIHPEAPLWCTEFGIGCSPGSLRAYNDNRQRDIDGIRAQMVTELGLVDRDIIDVPIVFMPNPASPPWADALTGGMVNMLVINRRCIVPKPFGPIVNGKDRFEEDLKSKLVPLGLRVDFIDTWDTYHVNLGEVHCATNTLRKVTRTRWWEFQP